MELDLYLQPTNAEQAICHIIPIPALPLHIVPHQIQIMILPLVTLKRFLIYCYILSQCGTHLVDNPQAIPFPHTNQQLMNLLAPSGTQL